MTFHVNPIELKDDGEADPAAAVTKALEDLQASVKEIESKSADRLNKLEARLNRPGQHQANDDTSNEIERKAFINYVRRGEKLMGADEVKALNVSTDAQGGYLVPEQFLAEIDRNLVNFSPIRQVARVAPTSSGEILLPKRTGQLTASWVGELEDRPETATTYGQQKFAVHELACWVDVSMRLLEDSAFDLQSELAYDFAEEFGRAESVAFINGNGTNKPKGLLTDTTITKVESFSAGAIKAEDLITLYHSLPAFYASNAVWAANRQTIGRIRAISNTSGQFLWQESMAAGNPPTILGRPVIEFPDMPDVAAGALPIAFGDFGHFRIFNRVDLSVKRDDFTQATKGLVRFHGRRRVGGEVSKAEAFRFLKIKA